MALTYQEAKERLRSQGIKAARWADEHQFSRRAVTRILNGVDKGRYGQSYEIAVALGMCDPKPTESEQGASR